MTPPGGPATPQLRDSGGVAAGGARLPPGGHFEHGRRGPCSRCCQGHSKDMGTLWDAVLALPHPTGCLCRLQGPGLRRPTMAGPEACTKTLNSVAGQARRRFTGSGSNLSTHQVSFSLYLYSFPVTPPSTGLRRRIWDSSSVERPLQGDGTSVPRSKLHYPTSCTARPITQLLRFPLMSYIAQE